MKRIISVIALVLAMTMVMSVSAFAAKSFSVADGAVTVEGMTVTAGADSLDVTVPTTANADYSILLVNGTALPTVDSSIAYINQAKAEGTSLDFDVLPKLDSCGETCTLYIGTNAAGESLISVPVAYLEQVTNDYITSTDTSKGTIVADVAKNGAAVALSDASMGAAVGNYVISLALDTTAYPNAGNAEAGYIVKAVNADGTADVEGATVYYSAERKKYVALIPSAAADYKFEILAADTEGATANGVITKYGNINEDANGAINALDYGQFAKIYKKAADAVTVTNAKKALIADITGDGKVNALDYGNFAKAYKKKDYTFAILGK